MCSPAKVVETDSKIVCVTHLLDQTEVILTFRESSNEAVPRRNRKDGSEYRLVKNRRSPQLPASMPGKIFKNKLEVKVPI